MFGLPIFRRRTPAGPENPIDSYDDIGVNGCTITSPTYDKTLKKCVNLYGPDPFKPKVLNSALRLCQMVLNHYSLIVSSDWKHLATWGSTPGTDTYVTTLGRTGVTSTSNKPQTSIINWKTTPQSIVKVFSFGYNNFTIFRTEKNELYGTGNNGNYVLNNSSTGIQNAFNIIASDVIDFCASGPIYLLYIKSNGKVYGLGPSNVGFGFPLAGQKDLIIDINNDSNYLNVDNAVRVYTTSPSSVLDVSSGTNHKSFVLKNDGTVMACGYNTDGCLGVNKTDSIVYEWSLVKKSDNNGVSIETLTNVVDIVTTNLVLKSGAGGAGALWAGVTGDKHMATYFITSDGFVYTCGNNIYGQLGLGLATSATRKYASKTSLTKASQICTAAGGTSVLVTTSEDKVYTWGNNQWGQLGLGDYNDRSSPTQATAIPADKIKMIHGGGMYGMINGAFLIVFENGNIYGAGYNETYALGVTIGGVPTKGPITTFTKNEFFGLNAPLLQDPNRFPLNLTGTITNGSIVVTNAGVSQNKTVPTPTGSESQTVFVLPGMSITGAGIPAGTTVVLVDRNKNEITISNPATATTNGVALQYKNIIKAYQADLCGYGSEMAQKVVSGDGTLYMSGWNQNVNDIWNFNYYYGDQNVSIPTAFDANFS